MAGPCSDIFPPNPCFNSIVVDPETGLKWRWDGVKWVAAGVRPMGGNGTVTSVLAGWGLLGTPNPIVESGIITLDPNVLGGKQDALVSGVNIKTVNGYNLLGTGDLVITGSKVTISATAPLLPLDGDLWFDSVDLQTYIWYNDGVNTQWVPVINQGAATVGVNIGTDTAPATPDPGELWTTTDGRLYIWRGSFWLQVA